MYTLPMLVLLVVAFLCVGGIFWSIGLFDESPPRRRFAFVALAALFYVGCQAALGLLLREGVTLASVLARFSPPADTNQWSVVMFFGCVLAAVRLLTFRRGPSRHRAVYAWASWFLIVSLTATAAKLALGVKPPPGPFSAIGTLWFAFLMVAYEGNFAHYVRDVRQAVDGFVYSIRRIFNGRLP